MYGDRRTRPREPAETHFRQLGEHTQLGCGVGRFDVYRADEVRTTSTRFVGGDWHWRLCDEHGRALVDAGGYGDERACRAAVALLQAHASHALAPGV
jgi:hypothetical protein